MSAKNRDNKNRWRNITVRSKGIAGELMEITFRNNDGKAPEDYEN